MKKKEKVIQVLDKLEKKDKKTMLESFKAKYTPFQILIAALMSARTKDTITIPVAEKLFRKCSDPEDFISIGLRELEQSLYPIGFYHVKAKNIKELSRTIKEKYSNKVPEELDKLLTLPGVGRKTANCALAYAFNIPAIAVDTHVHRISNRIGLVKTKTPEETEKELEKISPKESWTKINDRLVIHGQTICIPRKPKCRACLIYSLCDYPIKTPNT